MRKDQKDKRNDRYCFEGSNGKKMNVFKSILNRIRKFFYLTPHDLGMQPFTTKEIVEMMNKKR